MVLTFVRPSSDDSFDGLLIGNLGFLLAVEYTMHLKGT